MRSKGFTLLELLVTISILSILATVGMGQYQTSQMKARDAQRKADLDNVARALEMYYNDYEAYPLSDASGRIEVDGVGLDWGTEFSTDDAIYMKMLPKDPLDSDYSYCYESDGSRFALYAHLENKNDPDYYPDGYQCSGETYTYAISSSNFRPTPIPTP